ncbi:E3 ubiquitin-protein ligase BRE1-like 2 [Nymphaea thermarum]|nr:E3 ubiquitin-protein ligase BRE1-like 2 [Nymphaea thermarum]
MNILLLFMFEVPTTSFSSDLQMLSLSCTRLKKVIDNLNMKHKGFQEEIKTYLESHAADQSEIKHLSDELEESMAELEESRRKLVNLKVQNVACGTHIPILSPVNGVHSFEKPIDRTRGMRELKDSLDEAKILAARRLSELQEICEENSILSKQLKTLQNEMKDEKYVMSSRPYTTLSERVQHLKSELEKYKGLIDSLQAERNNLSWKEKELNAKAETADASREALSNAESRIQELEIQLQRCMTDKNDLELKLEEAGEDSGRKDIKSEFSVMAEALAKELGIMEVQLNRFKDIACEALSLREEVRSLREKIDERTGECKTLSDKCAANVIKIKSLKTLIERLEKERQELQIFLDMYGQECFEKRDIMEIKESEHRAYMQAEMLKSDLDEHSLELRVRAANEAESTCQQRLTAAEAEISDLMDKLDASQRHILEVKEAIKVKDEEAEAYISEIETIGQAYEDMQMQNRRLQQQVAERDDYNIKLVSESMKVKHAQSSLVAEKQALAKQLQQVNASLDFLKMRIARGEEQIKAYLAQAAKASQENRHLAMSVETAKVEQTDAEKELKWLKTAVESSEKDIEHNQKKFDELQAELEKERSENERLEEEVQKLRDKVEQMASESSEAAIEKLQEKIKEYKAVLKCSVCYERPKEVVITKCNHLFCSLCIQRNLEIRHRKCPGCGTAFGQNDVRTIHI